jgi:hypothetical protein
MPSLRSIVRSGASSALLLVLALSGCVTKYGLAGGGLPTHVRTMAIQPFDNETPMPEIQRELLDVMRRDLQSRLGVPHARTLTVSSQFEYGTQALLYVPQHLPDPRSPAFQPASCE